MNIGELKKKNSVYIVRKLFRFWACQSGHNYWKEKWKKTISWKYVTYVCAIKKNILEF